VYVMSCVSSSIWPKRHKQYRGEVNVTANGVTRTVDVDCTQGPMLSLSAVFSDVCR